MREGREKRKEGQRRETVEDDGRKGGQVPKVQQSPTATGGAEAEEEEEACRVSGANPNDDHTTKK